MEQSTDHHFVKNPNSSGDHHLNNSELLSGKARPGRCYVCSFCAREFRNAQALGGHMNVHRRERLLANQLLELRNQQGNGTKNLSPNLSGVVVAATSNNPPKAGELLGGELAVVQEVQDVMSHGACDMHELVVGELFCAGSSSSSSSPPSPQASGTSTRFASSLVQPWRDASWRLQRPSQCQKPLARHGSVDLELRLGLTREKPG